MPSASKAGKKKRRNYWPHPSFQKRFICQIIFCSLLGALLAGTIVFLTLLSVLKSEFSDYRFERQIKTFAAVKWVGESGAFDRELLSDPEILGRYQKRIYSRALTAAAQSFSMAILLLLPLLAGAGVLLSHNMVGGISRIEAHLQKIRKGESYETLVCREGDEMQPLVESLSAIDRNYVRRLKQIKESCEKVRESARILKRDLDAAGKHKLILQEQENALAQIEKILKLTKI